MRNADWAEEVLRRSDNIGTLLPKANTPEQRQYMLGKMAAFEEVARLLKQEIRNSQNTCGTRERRSMEPCQRLMGHTGSHLVQRGSLRLEWADW